MDAVFGSLPLVAAVLAVPQFLPQLARLRRTGETAGVSWSWAALISINNAAWLGYFALSGFWTALVPAVSATITCNNAWKSLPLTSFCRAKWRPIRSDCAVTARKSADISCSSSGLLGGEPFPRLVT